MDQRYRDNRSNSTDYTASQMSIMEISAVQFAVLAAGGQSGNFWIHPRIVYLGDVQYGDFFCLNCYQNHIFITSKQQSLMISEF
jgi:hypothetical protein